MEAEGLAPKAPPKAPFRKFCVERLRRSVESALRALKALKKLKFFGACGGRRGTTGPQWDGAFGAARINS